MPERIAILTAIVALLLAPGVGSAEEPLRDPTRPYDAKPAVSATGTNANASFEVTAIFTSDKRRVAIVNGRRVAEGDQVDGATVLEIQANRLRLNHRGKEITRRVLHYGFRS